MALIDFEGCEKSRRFYAGNAGRKIGVVWNGGNWILKFPGPTGRLQGSVPSYTTAPLSEFLGSHVYGMLGIPVHETVLGIRGGKVVCACRDFTDDDWELVEFHDLKNSLSDDEPGFTESASTGSGVVLADVRAAINRIPELAGIDGVRERFWDMFVTDAFIRNIDPNNTNWGDLSDRKGHYRLAPVYDNGNSFNNKRTEAAIERRLSKDELIRQDALDVRSCYITDRAAQIHRVWTRPPVHAGVRPVHGTLRARPTVLPDRFDPGTGHGGDRPSRRFQGIPQSGHGMAVRERVRPRMGGSARFGRVRRAPRRSGPRSGRTVWNRDPRHIGRDEAGSREMILVRGIRACGLSHSHRAHRLRSRLASRPRVRLS